MAIVALHTVDLRPPNTIGKTSTFDHKAFGRYRDGNGLIIEPTPQKTLLDILRSLEPLTKDDWFPDDIDAGILPTKAVNL